MRRQYWLVATSVISILCVIGAGMVSLSSMLDEGHKKVFHRRNHVETIQHVPVNPRQTTVTRPLYRITAKYDAGRDEVKGHMVLQLPAVASSELYFHLYPNVFKSWQFSQESRPRTPGYLRVWGVKVNQRPVTESINGTLMKVPMPTMSGAAPVRIDMEYLLHIPRGGNRLNIYKETAFLAQWYPMLAVKDKEGWHTDQYTTTGDPFYTQMADFEVTFRLPSGYQVISTGKDNPLITKPVVTVRQENVRDFAAVLTKDYQVICGKTGEVNVNLWYLKGMEKIAPTLHKAAISGMNFYSTRFGPYPYKEIDVVLGETGHGIAGMEYPGLVTSIPKIMTVKKGEVPAVNVVVHELAHQWWYGIVGSNQVKEPWLDEGLTTFSEFLYMKKEMKEDEKEFLKRAVEVTQKIHQSTGITSAQSLYRYTDDTYALMVYIRPAAMMFDLMKQLGEEKVLQIMREYYQQYRYKIATTQDFIRVANQVSGKNLTPFFQKWLHFK